MICFYKKFCLILVLSILVSEEKGIGQNLIPNFDFEQYSSCPTQTGQVDSLLNWFAATESPDFFNSCSSVPQVSIPQNIFGFQSAFSGGSYCGMHTHSPNNVREYIGVNFINSLLVNQVYYVSFYLSLSGGQSFRLGTNKFGIKLSSLPMSFNSLYPSNSAMFYTDSIITDTINWVFIKGQFTADSAYNYIYFGNFYDNQNTDTLSLGGQFDRGYYYIDDVCLSTDSNVCYLINNAEEIKKDFGIKLFPNPAFDYVSIECNEGIENIEVIDIMGNIINLNQKSIDLNQNKICTNQLKRGLYFIHFVTKNNYYYLKLIKH